MPDVKTCVIFDIDGTLVDSSAFDNRLYLDAVREVLGESDLRADWSEYEHVTDTGILMEICRRHGASIVDTLIRVRDRFGDLIVAYFDGGGHCPPVTGALPLFERLKGARDAALGIATGGWGHTANMKLEHAGFDARGISFGSADDHHTRGGIMRHCRAQLPAAARTVYVGDGEWDREACAELGWDFVGVGERLRGRCATWVPDLSAPVLGEILALEA